MNFKSIGILTIVSVYLLIFVGGVVRSTGSGMGCPDWPRCFGMWVPPTTVDELPLNYQEIYGAKLKGEVLFNPIKTWIEYLNRLLGVLIGLFVFFTFIFSLKCWQTNKKVSIFAGLAVLLTGFQGWLGSKVVASELAEYLVSLHMFVAILIVLILIYALSLVSNNRIITEIPKGVKSLLILVLIITFSQILLGTQVREKIDAIAKALDYTLRNTWVENVGIQFIIHRSFSLIVLITHIFLFYRLKFILKDSALKKLNLGLLIIILIEILTGVMLAYLDFPAVIQPIHLTLATLSIGIQAYIFFISLNFRNARTYN